MATKHASSTSDTKPRAKKPKTEAKAKSETREPKDKARMTNAEVKKPTAEAKKAGPKPKAGAAAGRTHASKAEKGQMLVRMYKLQLGDCFLLSFPKDGGGEFHMLIDCGLIQGADDPKTVMEQVAADIYQRTGGALDLVLITHEHWDHLSGFQQARDVFERIAFRQLWVGWTEDPDDALANALRTERGQRRRALDSLLDGLAAGQGLGDDPELVMAEALRAFAGTSAGGGGGKVGEASQWVKDRAAATRYCRPGELLTLPDVSCARVYVLGPPHDEALIHRSDPSTSHPETYLDEAVRQTLAVMRAADDGPAAAAPANPFDDEYGIDKDAAAADPLFARYLDPQGEPWRRVDADWLGPVGPLALQLDSDTNNTSLAIAIELLPNGKVLLFPGDAQVGNWLSWQTIKAWQEPGPKGQTVTTDVDELLARTVLYKVGHHGSHNATLREQGLERMTGAGLNALIPVVPNFAATVKRWKMPWPDLLARLVERTSSHVLDATAETSASGPGVAVNDRYIEVTVANGK